eukprot:1073592-Pleurochrysis_carterae.AAC.2
MEQSQGRFHQGTSRRRPPLRPGLAPHVCFARPAGLTLPRQVTPVPHKTFNDARHPSPRPRTIHAA